MGQPALAPLPPPPPAAAFLYLSVPSCAMTFWAAPEPAAAAAAGKKGEMHVPQKPRVAASSHSPSASGVRGHSAPSQLVPGALARIL